MAWNTIDNLPTFEDDSTSYTAELKEGQFLGESRNYRLEKNLGAGGMGEVWLASEIRGGVEIRKVVVKTLRPDRRGNEGAQEKALKQFQLIQTLNHTNICPIYVI
ncbi:MAG: protein kinase, partial [Thermoguttaceae bacterium]|nr:protein kinase [Thermoguttaceae bacterium]